MTPSPGAEHESWCLSVQPIHEDGPCNCRKDRASPGAEIPEPAIEPMKSAIEKALLWARLDDALLQEAMTELARLRSDRDEFRRALARDNETLAALRRRAEEAEAILEEAENVMREVISHCGEGNDDSRRALLRKLSVARAARDPKEGQ